jgi:hypothetical protein
MIDNFPEIISLEESDLLSSQRRSKSSTKSDKPKKRFLIEKKSVELSNLNKENISIRDIQSNDSIICNSIKPIERKLKKNELAQYTEMDDNSLYFSVNSNRNKIHSTDKIIDNNDVYIQLKEKYQKSKKEAKHWRSSFFNLLNNSISYDDTIKSLLEENRIHQEYIINVENKIDKLLSSCNSITNNFHNSLFKTLNNLNISNENISNLFIKNYNEVLNDYKKQLEIIADEKENLSTNLSIARHQQLQCTIKLEESQTRLYNLERARLEDLKILESYAKYSL